MSAFLPLQQCGTLNWQETSTIDNSLELWKEQLETFIGWTVLECVWARECEGMPFRLGFLSLIYFTLFRWVLTASWGESKLIDSWSIYLISQCGFTSLTYRAHRHTNYCENSGYIIIIVHIIHNYSHYTYAISRITILLFWTLKLWLCMFVLSFIFYSRLS